MNIIESNVFNLDDLEKKNIDIMRLENNDIGREDIKLDDTVYTDNAKVFKEKMQRCLKTCRGYNENIQFEEVILNKDNFIKYHHQLLGNDLLVVLRGDTEEEYRYLTPKGKVFITTDIKLIQKIQALSIPIKITYDYIPLIADEKVYSLTLLSKVIFDIEEDNSIDLIKHYLKPTTPINASSQYSIMCYMFNIFNKIITYIKANRYIKYIDMEQATYNITMSMGQNAIFDLNKISRYKETFLNKLTLLLQENRLEIEPEGLTKEKLLDYVIASKDIYPAIDKTALKQLNLDYMIEIIECIEDLELINYIENNNSMPAINSCNKVGCIDKGMDVLFNPTKKILLKGHFTDLYFKVLSEVLNNRDYCKLCESDNLIYNLLKDNIKENTRFFSHYLEKYIIARLNGYTNTEDMDKYFKEELLIKLQKKDINNLNNVYEQYLNELDEQINKFNEEGYTRNTKKIIVMDNKISELGKAVYDRIRLITKTLIKEMNLYINEFNERNKAKMELFYCNTEDIYVLVDEEALNIALDTLTRVMPNAFSEYCHRVTPRCIINIVK